MFQLPEIVGPTIISTKSPVVKQSKVSVSREGEFVILKIDGTALKMRHDAAMRIGHLLMCRGSEAKLIARF